MAGCGGPFDVPITPPNSSFGGYNCSFVEDPDNNFLCLICAKVLREPQLTDCCGNHYCATCLKKWLDNSPMCPLCREKNFSTLRDKKTERMIHELQVKCRNYPSGCSWIGQLRDLEIHLKRECPYVLTECSNRCAEVLQRKELSDHLENLCRLRKVQCEYCHIWGAYELIVDEHYDTCLKVPVSCPNACSEDLTMPREEVDGHIDICPCQKVQCQFQEIGCEMIIARKDMSTHMVSAQGDHLSLTLLTISGMKQALTAYETETAELRDVVQQKNVEQEEIKNLLFRVTPTLVQSASLSNGALSAMERHLAEEVEVCRDRPFMPVMIKMDNFEQWKSKRDPWYSLPFYTSTFGYKLCLCVYANGTCVGRNTHLSVYVHLMAGEFDDQLDWPIDEDINVMLQNQDSPSNHWDVECSFTNRCPQRVTRRVTIRKKVARTGSGSPTFILLSKLQHNDRHQYLKNDSLYFSIY